MNDLRLHEDIKGMICELQALLEAILDLNDLYTNRPIAAECSLQPYVHVAPQEVNREYGQLRLVSPSNKIQAPFDDGT